VLSYFTFCLQTVCFLRQWRQLHQLGASGSRSGEKLQAVTYSLLLDGCSSSRMGRMSPLHVICCSLQGPSGSSIEGADPGQQPCWKAARGALPEVWRLRAVAEVTEGGWRQGGATSVSSDTPTGLMASWHRSNRVRHRRTAGLTVRVVHRGRPGRNAGSICLRLTVLSIQKS